MGERHTQKKGATAIGFFVWFREITFSLHTKLNIGAPVVLRTGWAAFFFISLLPPFHAFFSPFIKRRASTVHVESVKATGWKFGRGGEMDASLP
jgi:hypothetical protein